MKHILALLLVVQTGLLSLPCARAGDTNTFQSAFDAGLAKSRYEKDYQGALADFTKALELATTDAQRADAQMYIALSYFHSEDYANAKTEGAKVVELGASNPGALSGTQLMLARIALKQDGDAEAAKDLLEQVISAPKANPTHRAEAHLYLGIALLKIGDQEQAAAEFKACLDDEKSAPELKLSAQKQLDKLKQ